MSTDADVQKFFQSSHFAVVGASANPAKWGYKVFRWYLDHSLPVQPVNPVSPAVRVDGKDHPTIRSIAELSDPANTSLSIVTPALTTFKVLEDAKKLGILAVWMQPGSFDEAAEIFARENFAAALAGYEGSRGSEGWCVFLEGERGLKNAGSCEEAAAEVRACAQ